MVSLITTISVVQELPDILDTSLEGVFRWVLYVIALLLGMTIGGIVVNLAYQLKERSLIKNSTARWPDHWPKPKELFTKNLNDDSRYIAVSTKEALGSGAYRLGRLYPRSRLGQFVVKHVPASSYLFGGLREWLLKRLTYEVWVNRDNRMQHVAIMGPTGKGKSTKFAIPAIALGAWEENTSYFIIDVKTPQIIRTFAGLYRKMDKRKQVLFVDPWSIDESLGFEPLWRATPEEKDIISNVIATYSPSGQEVQESGNSEFFNIQATRTIRGLLDLAQYWPRRFVNLPCVQQLVAAGGNSIVAAYKNAPSLQPSLEATVQSAVSVARATPEAIRNHEGNKEIHEALDVLDRSGFDIVAAVKKMRSYYEQHKLGKLTDEEFAIREEEFQKHIKSTYEYRQQELKRLIDSKGEFINMPDDTRNSVVATVANKLDYFAVPNIARIFSEDELQVDTLVKRPCLMVIGAPMAKLEVGSMFVASIMSNLATNAVFQRGYAIEKGEIENPVDVFMILDEFPQLNIRSAPRALATFRGFRCGLFLVYQDRGQLRKLYGDGELTNIETNCVHKVLLQGSHEDVAKHYADAIGDVPILKRSESGSSGEKSVSVSVERVPLMTLRDVKDMALNGEARKDMALSVGSQVPAFPLLPIPYFEDPMLRKLLGMKRAINKKGMPWQWKERWSMKHDQNSKFINRRPRDHYDPYEQIVNFLIGRPTEAIEVDGKIKREKVYYELMEPILDLDAIGARPPQKGASGMRLELGGLPGRTGQPSATGTPKPALGKPLAPTYGDDLRLLVTEDFRKPGAISKKPLPGGKITDRFATETATKTSSGGQNG